MVPFVLPLGRWDGLSGLPNPLNKEGLGFTVGETLAFTFYEGAPEFTFDAGQPAFTFRDDSPP